MGDAKFIKVQGFASEASHLAVYVKWHIRPFLGPIYQNMVCSTLVRYNILEYGIFNLGKVQYKSPVYHHNISMSTAQSLTMLGLCIGSWSMGKVGYKFQF